MPAGGVAQGAHRHRGGGHDRRLVGPHDGAAEHDPARGRGKREEGAAPHRRARRTRRRAERARELRHPRLDLGSSRSLMAVRAGSEAPEFTLPGTGGRDYSLSEYRGTTVVLVFYPGDNTPVCTQQLNQYTADIEKFTEVGAQVLAI